MYLFEMQGAVMIRIHVNKQLVYLPRHERGAMSKVSAQEKLAYHRSLTCVLVPGPSIFEGENGQATALIYQRVPRALMTTPTGMEVGGHGGTRVVSAIDCIIVQEMTSKVYYAVSSRKTTTP